MVFLIITHNKSRLNIVSKVWACKNYKKKLKSMKRVFAKYGNNLEGLYPFECPRNPKKFNPNLHQQDYSYIMLEQEPLF
jgi:hypothetical protein